MTLEPGLYVTATPIGNLKDITVRAIEALKAADLILCEDTRQTARLCAAYDIKTPRRAYHDHSGSDARRRIVAELQDGAAICLVSDAGTPLISDPGYKLVREVRREGLPVFALPGPSAFVAALSIAGAPSDRFLFAGFPPQKAAAREAFFDDLADVSSTLIFYETGPRLAQSLAAMAAVFGDRRAAVARELTKIHEEVVDGSLTALADRFAGQPPRGEIVVIVHPPAENEAQEKADPAAVDAFLRTALAEMSVKDAAGAAAETFGLARKTLYTRALAIKSGA